ncbi:MAG: hypothetical protein MSIBF_07200 [Candidatus Altiarchaeales archaeon IMC4]|nr:MAG: hypothetical protein MSIBF_07200 [Candidatus Altiarchaeales archaeon IMC4]
MEDYELLASPWKNEFVDVLKETEEHLFISSPFINVGGIKTLSTAVSKGNLDLTLLTSLTVRNIQNNITDPQAVLDLYDIFGKVSLSSLGRLHAKVYIVDEKIAVITSANLTNGGLLNNFEYGVMIKNEKIVKAIKNDLQKYFNLGNVFPFETLQEIAKEASELIKIETNFREDTKNTKLSKLLNKRAEDLDYEILKNRVSEGRTINSIFAETILYLLEKKGTLTTQELHPMIQDIHPDICDDSIDRIINGQHFGKRWKHFVRNAQQSLKNGGLIELKNNKWYLTD